MKQAFQSLGKGLILLFGSFLGALHPSTGSAMLSGSVAQKQQAVNVIRGIFPTVLMKHPGTSGKAHGSQSVILCDDKITGDYAVYQGVVNAVRPFVKHQGLGTFPVKFMGGIAEQEAGNLKSAAGGKGDVYHGTAVGIDQHFHIITS